MSHRLAVFGLLCTGFLFCTLSRGIAQGECTEDSVADVSLEIQALRTLRYLVVRPDQLRELQRLAAETTEPRRYREAEASDEYREALVELRDALRGAADNDRIEQLESQLDELIEANEIDIDDRVEITDSARRLAPELLEHLTAAQVATYIGRTADDISDPREFLVAALNHIRELDEDEWEDQRDEIAEAAARLVAGVAAGKAAQVHEQTVALLRRARAMKETDFQAERPELDKMAFRIAGDSGPMNVIQHALEYDLAELLSNPRLADAVQALLR